MTPIVGRQGKQTNLERFSAEVKAAETVIAGYIEAAAKNLLNLADGTAIRKTTTESYVMAGSLVRKGPLRGDDGQIVYGANGYPVMVEAPIYPELPAETLVLVDRKVSITELEPDRESNIYLLDRIIGKPKQSTETEITGPDGGPLEIAFKGAIERIYGQPEAQGQET